MISNYEQLPNGVIHQIKVNNQIRDYNQEYVNQSYNVYGEKVTQMSYLRLGYLLGVINTKPKSLLDVGYGNGSFIEACQNTIEYCYGNDINSYPLPANAEFVTDITSHFYDVITFFDSLEHFIDIDIVGFLKCNYVMISVPCCHNFSDDWFLNWKHRRPDEHLWHFNEQSLTNFFTEHNYTLVSLSNIEDTIRKPIDDNTNILTAIFKK